MNSLLSLLCGFVIGLLARKAANDIEFGYFKWIPLYALGIVCMIACIVVLILTA